MNGQEAIKRRERNLEFFRRFMPDLHRLVSRHSPSSQLIVTDTGEPDIQTPGGLVYQGRLGEVVAGQLQRFWRAPKRFLIPPLKPGQFDKMTNQFLDGLLKRAAAEKIEFADAPTTPESYFLAIFGIGLGLHIDELVEKTDCRSPSPMWPETRPVPAVRAKGSRNATASANRKFPGPLRTVLI